MKRKLEDKNCLESDWRKTCWLKGNVFANRRVSWFDLIETAQQFSEEEQVFECVVCNNTFNSLRTLKNHESSKKHLEQLTLCAEMDQFEEDDLLPESLEEVCGDPGASLVEKVVEGEEEGDILSGSRKKRVKSRSKAGYKARESR